MISKAIRKEAKSEGETVEYEAREHKTSPARERKEARALVKRSKRR